MSERRPLSEGIRNAEDIDPVMAKEFVYGAKVPVRAPEHLVTNGQSSGGGALRRVPLSTRIRTDYFEALKRASLERQLSHTDPSTLIDILEQAIEPWLRSNGYIP